MACFARVRVPGCSNCLPSFDKTWMSARRRLLGGLGFRIFTPRRETFRCSRFSGLLVACRMSQCRRRQAEQKSSGQEIRNLGVENQKSRKDSKPQTRRQIDSEKSKHRQRHTDTQTHTHTHTHTHSLSLCEISAKTTRRYTYWTHSCTISTRNCHCDSCVGKRQRPCPSSLTGRRMPGS